MKRFIILQMMIMLALPVSLFSQTPDTVVGVETSNVDQKILDAVRLELPAAIRHRVEELFLIPRELFLPDNTLARFSRTGYLPVVKGYTLPDPEFIARIINLWYPLQDKRILVIGPYGGYTAAVLSLFFPDITLVDPVAGNDELYAAVLTSLGISGIAIMTMNELLQEKFLSERVEAKGYSHILVHGSLSTLHEDLISLLTESYGELIFPISDDPGIQLLLRLIQTGGSTRLELLGDSFLGPYHP
jgi:protein-L-isoaspartate O-methyltransferase